MVDLDELIAERPDDHRVRPDLWHVLIDPARSVVELQFVGGQGVAITPRGTSGQYPGLMGGFRSVAEVVPLVQPADMRQAEYYKTVLAERRTHLDAELADHCVPLAEDQDNRDLHGVRHLHQVIGKKRREQFEVDCLLRALDHRFFPSLASKTRLMRCFDIEIAQKRRCWTIHIPEINGRIKAPSRDEVEMMAREHIAVSIGAPIAEIAVQVVTRP